MKRIRIEKQVAKEYKDYFSDEKKYHEVVRWDMFHLLEVKLEEEFGIKKTPDTDESDRFSLDLIISTTEEFDSIWQELKALSLMCRQRGYDGVEFFIERLMKSIVDNYDKKENNGRIPC